MQRNRIIRRVMPEGDAGQQTNIFKRSISKSFKGKAVVQPNTTVRNVPKSTRIVNSAKVRPMDNLVYDNVEKIWDKETVYIIGGGPSLQGFNFNHLLGSNVIAINKAIFYYQMAQVLYWTDCRFYTWYKNDIDNFKCSKYTIKPQSNYASDVKLLKRGVAHGLEESNDTLAHGNNSGYAAINLAYHLGAKRIILLGYDMGRDGEKSHFHDGYPSRPTRDGVYSEQFLPMFQSLNESLKKKGVNVMNASPYSRLQVFPKITHEQALMFR